jgi:hypothetical protein
MIMMMMMIIMVMLMMMMMIMMVMLMMMMIMMVMIMMMIMVMIVIVNSITYKEDGAFTTRMWVIRVHLVEAGMVPTLNPFPIVPILNPEDL